MHIVLTVAGSLAALYVLALAGLYLLQRRILFQANTRPPDFARVAVPDARVMTVTTEDGLSLLAWYMPPARDDGRVVLYLHGNAGNIGNRAYRFGPNRQLGWGLLLLEYRGYGGNPGSPSEAGLLIDARAGMAALLAMGFTPDRILLWGASLGTGLAVQLAAERPVAALLLEAPYTSIAALARMRFRFAPVDLLLRDRFDSLSVIGRVRAPILVMHGANDRLIPVAVARALYEAAPEPKQLWIAPEGGHNHLVEAGAIDAAGEFVERMEQEGRMGPL